MDRQKDRNAKHLGWFKNSSGMLKSGAAVFAVAAAVRLVYLFQSSTAPTFHTPIVDAGTYDLLARNIASGKPHGDLFWQPVFYPLWLAAVYRLGGGILSVKVLQMLLGSCTCVLVFAAGARLSGRKGGLIAGIIAAFYMPMVFLEGELLSTVWECFWFIALMLLALRVRQNKSCGLCVALGLCGGLAAITRPNLIIVAAWWWLWLLWSWLHERPRSAVPALLACGAAGLAMPVLPVAAWSHATTGRFSILPHSGGINVYIGNNPSWQRTVAIRPGYEWRRLTELPFKEGLKGRAAANLWFYRQVWRYVLDQPQRFMKGLGQKSIQFLSSREIPRNVDVYMYRQWSGLLAAGVWKAGPFGFPFGLLLPLAVVGGWKLRHSIPAAVWVAATLYAATVIVVFVAGRYRMPVVPLLSIFAACGLLAVVEAASSGNWAKVAANLAVVVLAAGAMSLPGPFPQELVDYRSELHFELGNAFRDRGRPAEAEESYRRAIELRPDYADAHADLASLLKDRDAVNEAISHYEAAIRGGLETAAAEAGLGEALVRAGRFEEALEHFRRAAALAPENAKVHNNLGNLFAMKGRYREAIGELNKALELEPGDAATLNNLGNVMAATGDFAGAEQMYRRSIALQPGNAATHYHLGLCLRQAGRNEEARKAFEEALRLDPSHAGAAAALRFIDRGS